MDKLAAGIVDKLSIVGFFNVIISGSVLLYGISPILDRYAPDIFYLKLGLEKDIEKAIVACLMCYLFGCALQSIQEFSFKWLKSNIASRCLATIDNEEKQPQEKPIISNAQRRIEVTKLADKLFKKKNQGTFDPNNKEMCSYFIDYCEYSNSVKGYGSKASRYSESATFFEQLAVAFFTLTVIGIFIVLFVHPGELQYLIGYTVLGGIFTGRAYQCRLNWAKTVLSTYEAVADKEEYDRETSLGMLLKSEPEL